MIKLNFLPIFFIQTNVTSPVDDAAEPESQKLQEKWEATKCKTKLIAL